MTILAGIDIGGTKCAVCLGRLTSDGVTVIGKQAYPTPSTPELAMQSFIQGLESLALQHGVEPFASIGISCGGPLDSRRGRVLSPPNLPGWDDIDVITPLKERFGVPVAVQNDANAGALAEWKWGAGKGFSNVIFLTFGTGMGAGLILDGRLYSGTNDMAGEVGHMRLAEDGPVGFGKAGSFEGFCSGGGIAKLARSMAETKLAGGPGPLFCPTKEDLDAITTLKVGQAAQQGDEMALEVFRIVGRQLGRGLALLVDILNPERIVIGSIYGRQQNLLEPVALEELRREALSHSTAVCEVVPAALQESIGDLACLSVALNVLNG